MRSFVVCGAVVLAVLYVAIPVATAGGQGNKHVDTASETEEQLIDLLKRELHDDADKDSLEEAIKREGEENSNTNEDQRGLAEELEDQVANPDVETRALELVARELAERELVESDDNARLQDPDTEAPDNFPDLDKRHEEGSDDNEVQLGERGARVSMNKEEQAIDDVIAKLKGKVGKRGWWWSKPCDVQCQARKKACGSSNCKVAGCQSSYYRSGWHIRGTDRGCCSNYSGCCYYASSACYYHDMYCQCCKYQPFCGPSCRKHSSCRK